MLLVHLDAVVRHGDVCTEGATSQSKSKQNRKQISEGIHALGKYIIEAFAPGRPAGRVEDEPDGRGERALLHHGPPRDGITNHILNYVTAVLR